MTRCDPAETLSAISGYGQTGPSAQLPAYAPVIHAASGYDLAHMAYQGEAKRPDYCGIYIADVLTGTYAFAAITAALYQREMSGKGQMIDVSMLESMLTLTLSEIQAAQFAVTPPGRPIFGPVATADGYINLSIASERTFQNLAVASGHERQLRRKPGDGSKRQGAAKRSYSPASAGHGIRAAKRCTNSCADITI